MANTKRILFVDDDPQLLEVIRMVLSQLAGPSWIINTAENIAEALSIIQDQQIDLVVVDLHMPVVDGVQFLGLLNRKYPDLLKVVLTSDATEEQRAVCLSQGAELYLQKPRAEHEWRTIQESLDALVQFKPQEGFRGVLRRVGCRMSCKWSVCRDIPRFWKSLPTALAVTSTSERARSSMPKWASEPARTLSIT